MFVISNRSDSSERDRTTHQREKSALNRCNAIPELSRNRRNPEVRLWDVSPDSVPITGLLQVVSRIVGEPGVILPSFAPRGAAPACHTASPFPFCPILIHT